MPARSQLQCTRARLHPAVPLWRVTHDGGGGGAERGCGGGGGSGRGGGNDGGSGNKVVMEAETEMRMRLVGNMAHSLPALAPALS